MRATKLSRPLICSHHLIAVDPHRLAFRTTQNDIDIEEGVLE